MFNKGDRVRIIDCGNRPEYLKTKYKIGTIKAIKDFYGEDVVFYVEFDDKCVNPINRMTIWRYTRDMLERITDDTKGYDATELDYIINHGKENKMEILEIYYERKKIQLEINHEKEINKIKMKDEKYARFIELRKELEQFEKENTISFRIDYAQFKFSNEITEMGEKCNNKYHTKNKELEQLIDEVKSQLSMCETYEQKQNVLRNYEIIDEKGKINA